MSTSHNQFQWFPRQDYTSWNLIRLREHPKSPWDVDVYVTPGKTRPRRWLSYSDALTFAGALNSPKVGLAGKAS